MKIITSVLVLLVIVFSGCSSKNPQEENPVPDSEGYYSATAAGVTFKWKYNGANIDCKMSAPAAGWIAVGFEPYSMMLGADLLIGYYSAGTVTLRDDYGSGLNAHSADTANGGADNFTGVSGTESSGVTEITFSRPVNTGDSNDKVLTQGVSRKIIMAYGSSDDFSSPHASRGSVTVVMH